ncbi:membrane protein [Paenibacillus assamensis]|uniref:membrane protein n=1 Tax=Paenibacillus assamensis TaxID=311244 RepID=UPI000490EA16|nr:membrane protein [Paenibacillus assamensis]
MELSWLHGIYLTFILLIIGCLIKRRDTTLVCIVGILLLGWFATSSLVTAVSGIFSTFIYAMKELMPTILIISIIVGMSRVLLTSGIHEALVAPFTRFMRSPAMAYWTIGIVMMTISLFFWPSPAVALVGAVLLPAAIRVGLPPLAVAMAMNLFGHGIALSGDFIIQGAPKLTADAAGIPVESVISASLPLVLVMGAVTTGAAFWLIRRDLRSGRLQPTSSTMETRVESTENVGKTDSTNIAYMTAPAETRPSPDKGIKDSKNNSANHPNNPDYPNSSNNSNNASDDTDIPLTGTIALTPLLKRLSALLIVLLFALDVMILFRYNLQGGEATALVGGTAVLILLLINLLTYRGKGLEQTTTHLIDGFLFGFKVFGPVIPIAAFFYLGDAALTELYGSVLPTGSHGIVNDLGVTLAHNAPVHPAVGAVTMTAVGTITGLDGSGFSGISLAGSVASVFGSAIGGGTATLTALGQVAAIWVGGGTLIPWALIPAAAICGVSPFELARRNLIPVFIGLTATTLLAIMLLMLNI